MELTAILWLTVAPVVETNPELAILLNAIFEDNI
jgi:hypothetical protein